MANSSIERKIQQLKFAFNPRDTEGLQINGWNGSDPQQLTLIRAYLIFELIPHCKPQNDVSEDGTPCKSEAATIIDLDGITPLLKGFEDPNLVVQLPAALALALLTTKMPDDDTKHDEQNPSSGTKAARQIFSPQGVFRRILANVKIAMTPMLERDSENARVLELRNPRGGWNTQGELLFQLKLDPKDFKNLPEMRLPEVLADGAYAQAVICLLANLIEQLPALASRLIQQEVWILYHFRAVRRVLRETLHPEQLEQSNLIPTELLNPTHWPNSMCPFPSEFCSSDALSNFNRVLSALENCVWNPVDGGNNPAYEATTAQVHGLVALCLDFESSNPVFPATEPTVAVYVQKKEVRGLVNKRAQQPIKTCRDVLAECLKILQAYQLQPDDILKFEEEVASDVHPSSWPGAAPDLNRFSALCLEGTKLGSGLITQRPNNSMTEFAVPRDRLSGAAVETNKERALLSDSAPKGIAGLLYSDEDSGVVSIGNSSTRNSTSENSTSRSEDQ